MTGEAQSRRSGRWALVALLAILAIAGLLALFPYEEGGNAEAGPAEAIRTDEVRHQGLERATFTADRRLSAPDTPLIVLLERGRSGYAATFLDRPEELRRKGGEVLTVPLALPRGGTRAATSVIRWGRSDAAVASVERTRGDLRVVVASLDSKRALFDRRVAIPDEVERDFAVAIGPFDGARADLALLETAPKARTTRDRATGQAPVGRLHVLEGDGRFRGPATSISLPLPSLSASQWRPVLARVEGVAPDLVLVRATGAEFPEVHVLSGESGYQRFIFQARLLLSKTIAARADLVPALEDGKPVLKVVDKAKGRALVRVFRLGPG